MLRTISFIVLALVFYSSQAQTSQKRDSLLKTFLNDQYYCDNPEKSPPDKRLYSNKQFISNYSMMRLLQNDLTRITLDDQGLPSLGNYATVSYSDDKAKITLNGSIYNPFSKKGDADPIRSIATFNVKAATKDNVSKLFSNKNANNEVTMKLKWSFLGSNTLYEQDDQMLCNKLKLYRERLWREYQDMHAYYLIDTAIHNNRQFDFTTKSELIKKKVDSLEKALNTAATDEERRKLKALFDSSRLEKLVLSKEYTAFQQKRPTYDSSKILDSFYTRLLDLETKHVKWTRFRISWIDIESSMGGEKYTLFSQQEILGKQVVDTNFTRWSVGVTGNVFLSKYARFFKHGIFFKWSYTLGNDNSLTGEDPKELSNKTFIDTAGFRREVLEKMKAYDIVYTKKIAHTFSAKLSKYLNEKRNQALSISTSILLEAPDLKEFYKFSLGPNLTPGIGYFYGFQNKEKDKNAVNVEVFFNFKDLFNVNDKDTKFYERHEIGFKLGVPFNSIFLNN